jgi:hypothetical protein
MLALTTYLPTHKPGTGDVQFTCIRVTALKPVNGGSANVG